MQKIIGSEIVRLILIINKFAEIIFSQEPKIRILKRFSDGR